MTAPLQSKRHRVGLLISPAPWVAVRRETGVDEDGEEFVAYEVLRAIIPLVMLRRTQASVLEVNGQYIRIGDSIPPYRICSVELEWDDERQFQEYNTIYRRYIRYLTSGRSTATSLPYAVPGSGKPAQIKGSVGTRSFYVHRILTLITFNKALHTLLERTGRKNLVHDVHQWYDKFADKGMSHYFDLTKPGH